VRQIPAMGQPFAPVAANTPAMLQRCKRRNRNKSRQPPGTCDGLSREISRLAPVVVDPGPAGRSLLPVTWHPICGR
jgi:hypothetical protein